LGSAQELAGLPLEFSRENAAPKRSARAPKAYMTSLVPPAGLLAIHTNMPAVVPADVDKALQISQQRNDAPICS